MDFYPEPQFERKNWMSLNGIWDASIGKDKFKINVPFALESPLSGVQRHLKKNETLKYKRNFKVPESFGKSDVYLHFEAVDYECEVKINKKTVIRHTGGYTPFAVNITENLKKGENTLEVYVKDPTENGSQQRGKQVGKSNTMWYNATSGIWKDVWICAVSKSHISKIKYRPDIDNKQIEIFTETAAGKDCETFVSISFRGEEIISEKLNSNSKIDIKDLKLWSPETPNLYDTVFTLKKNGKIVDEVKSYFGMRKFELKTASDGFKRFFLNNKPYFINGLLDQGYWPESGMTPENEDAIIKDIATVKRLGFNTLRKHIKVETKRWYYNCDKLGILVMQDMVSGGEYIGVVLAGVLPLLNINVDDSKYRLFKRKSKASRDEYIKDLHDMIENLYNCVSIFAWVPFNEGWGQFDAKQTADYVRNLDDSRLIDHASGWYDKGAGDFKSVHKYILPFFTPSDADRAVLLSEFGGYSMNIPGHTYSENKSFGYQVYRKKESLTSAYKKLYEHQIIPAVKKGLCGCIYTQISDVEHEVNGIMTYDRQIIKIDEDTIIDINNKLNGVNK